MSSLPLLVRPAHLLAPSRPNDRTNQIDAAPLPSDRPLPAQIEARVSAALGYLTPHRHGGPIKLKSLDDYLMLLHDPAFRSTAIHDGFRRAVQAVQRAAIDHDDLCLAKSALLAAVYVATCQERAYLEDGSFDCAGMSRFLTARLGLSAAEADAAFGLSSARVGERIRASTSLPDRRSGIRNSRFYRTDTLFGVEEDRSGPMRIGKLNTSGKEICDRGFQSAYLANAVVDFAGRAYDHMDMRGAILTGAHLKDGTLRKGRLDGANLTGAHLESIVFEDCQIAGVALCDAVFTNCTLRRCHLIDCDMTDAALVSGKLIDVFFQNCRLQRARLGKTTYGGAEPPLFCRQRTALTLDQVRFVASNLERISAENTDFNDCIFSNSGRPGRLAHAAFVDCSFFECDFRYCDASHTLFDDSPLRRSTLAHADFSSSRGADMLHRSNNIGGLKCDNARFDLDPRSLVVLNTPDGRERHLTIAPGRDGLLSRIVDFPTEVNRPLFAKVTQHLVSLADEGGEIDNGGNALLPRLCRLPYMNDESIGAFIDWRLRHSIGHFNTVGLTLSGTGDNDWHLAAVPRIARHLADLTDVATIRELSPLLCQIRAAACLERVALSRELSDALASVHDRALPEALRHAYCDVSGGELASAAMPELTAITRSAKHAVVLSPVAWMRLMTPEGESCDSTLSFGHYSFVLDKGTYQCVVEPPRRALKPFPLLLSLLKSRGNELKERLVSLYPLPAELRAVFLSAMLEGQARDLTAQDIELAETFLPLTTSLEARPASVAAARAVTLDPRHKAQVLRTFSDVYDCSGNAAREAHLLLLLSQIFFRAASASVFGSEFDSPLTLRHYAWAAFNSACGAAPRSSRHNRNAAEIAEQAYGLKKGILCCSAIIADLVADLRSTPASADKHFANTLLPYLW